MGDALQVGAGGGQSVVVGALDHPERVEVGHVGDLPEKASLGQPGGRLAGPGHGVAGQRLGHGSTQPVLFEAAGDTNLELDAPRLHLVVEQVDGLVDDAEGHALLAGGLPAHAADPTVARTTSLTRS
jgi:hypothetical protein